MKKYLLFIGAFLSSASGYGQSLRERAREEKLWTPIEIRLNAESDQVAAYGHLTPNKTWLIEQIAADIDIPAHLTSPYAANLGLYQFNRHCNRVGLAFPAARELNRKHRITLTLPNWEAAVTGAKGPQAMRLLKVHSRLGFEPKANTLLYAKIDPRIIERSIEAQVQAQFNLLRQQGSIEIEINGHDYLACDYVQGLTHIALEGVWELAGAKLKRAPVVRASELESALQEVKTNYMSTNNCTNNLIVGSALLTTSLNSVSKKTVAELGVEAYLAFFNAAYDVKKCEWRESSQINFTENAAEFDVLSEQTQTITSRLFSRFNGVIK